MRKAMYDGEGSLLSYQTRVNLLIVNLQI